MASSRLATSPTARNGTNSSSKKSELLSGSCGDGRRHEVTLVEHPALEPLAAEQDLAFLLRLIHRALPPGHRLCVDHRAEVDVLLR